MKFKAGDHTYITDRHGAVHQINPQPFQYDSTYVKTYDTPDYRRRNEVLQAMRLCYATAVHGRPIDGLCDVGFGNGAFLQFAAQEIPVLYGSDISGVEPPPGVTFLDDVRHFTGVLTYWDCLEHIHNLAFLQDLKAETLVISLPHYPGRECFPEWCHRKPNEHVHFFDQHSLPKFMKSMGWHCVAISKHEDVVRRREGIQWNILSAGFKRK